MEMILDASKLEGKWISLDGFQAISGAGAYFRREFTLAQAGVLAEMLLAAPGCSYHLLVNDRHVHFSPCRDAGDTVYVDRHDLTYYLETGTNVMAVVLCCEGLPRGPRAPEDGLIWCQLAVDGKNLLATDGEWRVFDGGVSRNPRFRRVPLAPEAEFADFSRIPRNFTRLNCPAKGWADPITLDPVSSCRGILLMVDQQPPDDNDDKLSGKLTSIGGYEIANPLSYFDFGHVVNGNAHFAESFVQTAKSGISQVEVFCSCPYKLFLDGRLVAAAMPGKSRNTWFGDKAEFELRAGWNRLLMVVLADGGAALGAVAIKGKPSNSTHFQSEPSTGAPHGWRLRGPLMVNFRDFNGVFAPPDNEPGEVFCPTWDHLGIGAAIYRNSSVIPKDAAAAPRDTITIEEGGYARFQFDGKIGFVELPMLGAKGDIVDVAIGAGGGAPVVVDTLTLADGKNSWFRHAPLRVGIVEVRARRCASPIEIVSRLVRVPYRRSSSNAVFECANDEYKRMWDQGVETIDETWIDFFVENPEVPSRRSLVDSMVKSLSAACVSGDYRMLKRVLTDFGLAAAADGAVPAELPCHRDFEFSGESMLWTVWLWYYLNFSGDTAFGEWAAGVLDGLWRRQQAVAKAGGGLLRNRGRTGGQEGDTVFNSHYCRFLLSSASVYDILDCREHAAKYRGAAADVAKALRKAAWNPDLGLFADRVSKKGFSQEHSCHANIMALYSGIATTAQYESVSGRFFRDGGEIDDAGADVGSGLPYFFLLETAFAHNRVAWGLDFLRKRWSRGGKIPVPNAFLVRELVGIRAAKPGFTDIIFSPAVDMAAWLKVSIPTPYGRVSAEWETMDDGRLSFNLDANYPLSVAPIMPEEVFAKATFHCGSNIKVIAAE